MRDTISDFADVRGQMPAKRALTIAAAGGHNILLNGPPGSGKTMLAMRLCGIMPEPTDEERLEIAMIASLANKPGTGSGGGGQRPFRQPHHTIPETTMVGGGSRLSPGEVTLAHRGVLFLDEFPEFRRPVLEALRQPLENRRVVVARLAGSAVYPANFLLVAAMNPCPCGYYGDERRVCRCTATQIRRYRERLSGPLLDRIDLRVDLRAVDYRELAGDDGASGTSSVEMSDSRSMRAAVELARAAQRERFPGGEPCVNGQMPPSLTERFCRLDAAGKRLLELAFHKYRLSARSYQKVLKVARTIADLEGEKTVRAENLAEALRYRVEQVHED